MRSQDLNMTLEQLENDYWQEPSYDSFLVKTCHLLRKKQLKDFDTEELRIMIGQNFSLNYLIPIALNILNNNLLAEGDYYIGDLLVSVLKSDSKYWKSNENDWTNLDKLMSNKFGMFTSSDLDESTKSEILNLYEKFKKIKAY
jgi:hypothetical protein